jgi:hypothetical protein
MYSPAAQYWQEAAPNAEYEPETQATQVALELAATAVE